MMTTHDADPRHIGRQALIRFIRNASVSAAMFDREMNYLAWSQSYARENRLEESDFVGNNHYDLFPDLPKKWKAAHQRCLAGASESSEEDLYIKEDGRHVWYEWEMSPWYETDNDIGGLVLQRKNITERKLDKQHLLQFQQMVDDNADYIALLDKESRFQVVNKAYLNANRKNKDEIIGCTPAEIFGRETFQTLLRPNAIRCMQGDNVHSQAWLTFQDGKRRFVDIHYAPFYDEHGEISGYITNGRDITNRQKLQDQLNEVRLQNKLILESAGAGIYGLDSQGRTTFVNPAAEQMLGWSKEELIGKLQHDIIHHSHADGTTFPVNQCPIYRTFTRGSVYHTSEDAFWRKDGSVFPVEYTVTPIIQDGKNHGAVVVFRDISQRKEIEDKLKLFEFATENIADSVYWMNPDGSFYYVNDAACNSLGYSRDELLAMSVYDIDPGITEAQWNDFFDRIKAGEIVQLESQHITKSGGILDVEITANYLAGKDFEFDCAVVRDITERKQTEMSYRSLFNQAAVGISRKTPEGIFIDINDKACDILGHSRQELLNMGCRDITHPDDIERDQIMMRKALDGELDEYNLEKRYIRKDGETVWINLTVSLIRHDDGRPNFFITIIEEIEARKKAELALQHSEQRYRSLMEATTSIIWTTDPNGEFIEPQSSWEKFTGQGWPEHAGFGWANMLHPDDIERIKSEWLKAIKTHRLYKTHARVWNKDLNEWRNFDVSAVPIIDAEGVVQEWVGFNTDTTQSYRLEKKLIHTQELLNKTEQIARVGGWEYDLENERLLWTDMTYELHEVPYNYSPTISKALDFYYGDSRQKIEAAFNKLMKTGERFDLELRFKTAKEKLIWVRAIGEPIYQDNTMISVAGTFEDTTARKNYEDAMLASEEKYRTLVESSPYSIYQLNSAGKIISMNQAGLHMFDAVKESDVLGNNFLDFVHPSERGKVQSDIDNALAGAHMAFEFHSTNGLDFSSTLVPIYSKDGNTEVERLLGITLDITESKLVQKQLNYQASHDALTQLINRREFEIRARRLLDTVASNGGEHALCFMDLDQFKVVNDTCGHTAGDELLRQISTRLKSVVRKRDTLARLGGDEFGVLLEHCSRKQAVRVAEEILEAVQNFVFSWQGQTFKIGVSIGLVSVTKETANLTNLLKNADTACYMAKDRGRNRIYIYKEDDDDTSQRQGEMKWVTRLHEALDNDRFCLYAQLIEPLGLNGKSHYELLVRMLDEQNEIIPPGAFLPAAERYNLITRLDRWVIDHAFELLLSNPDFLEQVEHVSINLSGQSINDPNTLIHIMDKFIRHDSLFGKICFEITETSAIANLTQALEFINKLKQFQCRFALDDFGSGLSSFAYLKNLPVDYLKIDGMFVRDIVDDPIDHAMVRSINDIGQVMGMMTIAEFVESDMIKGMLKEIGVNYAQGYGVEKPVPFEELLRRSNNIIPLKHKK